MAPTEALGGVSITISGTAITFVINKFYMTSWSLPNPNPNPNLSVIKNNEYSYPDRDIVATSVTFFYLVDFLCIMQLASAAAFTHNFLSRLKPSQSQSHRRYRVVNLLVHLLAALMMIDSFLTVDLLNETHYLPESSSVSLFIFLIVTVSFVCVMGYEAWKKRNVLEYGRAASKSSFVMFGGLALLSQFLFPLINILVFGNFEKFWIESDKAKHSLHAAAISFCFLSYILGVIGALLSSYSPKVHSKSHHREKAKNALIVLNFIFIFLVIVTVITITACHLGEYALLNAIPLLAGIAGLKYLNIVAVLLGVLLAAIIEGQSTSYGDMHKLLVDMCILLVSMGLVSYLSQKLATLQTTPSKPSSQQKVKHVD